MNLSFNISWLLLHYPGEICSSASKETSWWSVQWWDRWGNSARGAAVQGKTSRRSIAAVRCSAIRVSSKRHWDSCSYLFISIGKWMKWFNWNVFHIWRAHSCHSVPILLFRRRMHLGTKDLLEGCIFGRNWHELLLNNYKHGGAPLPNFCKSHLLSLRSYCSNALQ